MKETKTNVNKKKHNAEKKRKLKCSAIPQYDSSCRNFMWCNTVL
jgi:hypothetical protein